MKNPRFYFIEYGSQETILSELHYSLATLQAEGVNAESISIATDSPSRYSSTNYDIIDISEKIPAYRGEINYGHRIKPSVIIDALRSRNEPLVLLDTDTYFKPGFLTEIENALKQGVGMNFFIRRDPYRGFGPFSMTLPSGIHYSYGPRWSLMYNSGVLAVTPEHMPIIEDSLALIDGLYKAGLTSLDIDQFAATETFRLHGIRITPVFQNIHHYHSRWTRKYILWRLSRGPKLDFSIPRIRRPDIAVNKTIVRIFKGWQSVMKLWGAKV
ncbi:MAG: hypothetical protein WCO61_02925 [Alphaproteobacteria bacterium]